MYEDLFQKALNIEEPWVLESVDFDPDAKRIDIYLDFAPGTKFGCPVCNKPECSAYDTKEKEWRHLDFFQHKAFLHCRVPRVICDECGIHQIKIPWARETSGFTLLMDALIMSMAQSMQISEIADMIGEHDTRVWRVVKYYVEDARSREDFSDVSIIGIDETSSAKGHKYVTLVVDFATSKVIYVCRGKDALTLSTFKEDYLEHRGSPDKIASVCCDMSPAFIGGIETEFPNASITFDKFHIMKIVNGGIDMVRREEQAINKVLKKTRYIWLKNPDNLTKEQNKTLGTIKDMNLKTVRAYNLKLSLQMFWDIQERGIAEQYLKKWYFWATHSRLKPMIKAAKTIKDHWDGVLNYFDSKITNGILEGTNSVVQLLKRSARGYRNIPNFITMIYLRLGHLKFHLPT
ncbi:MAG: ISL3 family transposase [Methanosarcinales archaeon]